MALIDKLIGERLGIGKKAEEGFVIMAKAIFSMSGILYLYPYLSSILVHLAKFITKSEGSDPAILISCLLPIDMGGYHISFDISNDKIARVVGGVLLSSTLGATLSFTYPVAFGILKRKDWNDFVRGSLIGLISIPLSILFTSIIYRLDIVKVLKLMGLVIIISLILAAGIVFNLSPILNFMKYLGKFMSFVNIIVLFLFFINKLLSGVISSILALLFFKFMNSNIRVQKII